MYIAHYIAKVVARKGKEACIYMYMYMRGCIALYVYMNDVHVDVHMYVYLYIHLYVHVHVHSFCMVKVTCSII